MSTSARSEKAVRYAFCARNGVIGFGDRVPRGQMELAQGEDPQLTDAIIALARHSRTEPVLLLVPGVPEADSTREAEYAARVFANRVRAKLANGQALVPPPVSS